MSVATTSTPIPINALRGDLGEQGFAFVDGMRMREWLAEFGGLVDWASFAASWNQLPLDDFMADQGRYRRRRYAVYAAESNGSPLRCAHQPHYQGLSYNSLNGGVERWFEPIEESVGAGDCMQTVLGYAQHFFSALAPRVARWHIEVHQFRIEAQADRPGLPTPEGKHRDGVDFVLVLLIARHNIASGTTSIHALDGSELGAFTLTRPLDAALVDDHRVFHGVTAVEAVDPTEPSYRDVLVVTFRALPEEIGGSSEVPSQPGPRA